MTQQHTPEDRPRLSIAPWLGWLGGLLAIIAVGVNVLIVLSDEDEAAVPRPADTVDVVVPDTAAVPFDQDAVVTAVTVCSNGQDRLQATAQEAAVTLDVDGYYEAVEQTKITCIDVFQDAGETITDTTFRLLWDDAIVAMENTVTWVAPGWDGTEYDLDVLTELMLAEARAFERCADWLFKNQPV